MNPNFLQPYYALARLYLIDKKEDMAILQYHKLLEKNPKQTSPHMVLEGRNPLYVSRWSVRLAPDRDHLRDHGLGRRLAQGMARSAKLRGAGTVPTRTSLCHQSDRGVRSKLGRRPAGHLAFGRSAQIGREEED